MGTHLLWTAQWLAPFPPAPVQQPGQRAPHAPSTGCPPGPQTTLPSLLGSHLQPLTPALQPLHLSAPD